MSPGLDAKLLEAVGEIKGLNSDVSRGADDDISLDSLSPEKEAPVPQLISDPSDEQFKSLEENSMPRMQLSRGCLTSSARLNERLELLKECGGFHGARNENISRFVSKVFECSFGINEYGAAKRHRFFPLIFSFFICFSRLFH